VTSVLAIDQGTQSTKALIVGPGPSVASRGAAPLDRTFPQTGWVEQDAEAIWSSVVAAAQGITDTSTASPCRRSARPSSPGTPSTGLPLGPALSWQDQRAVAICERLAHLAEAVESRTGLLLDPMFSAAKISWLLDAYDPDRSRARTGRVSRSARSTRGCCGA
jgi:glycerol kinase